MEVRQDKELGGLVLTRRDGESFLAGDDIEITVLEARSGRARLPSAPRKIAAFCAASFFAPSSNEPSHDGLTAGGIRP